MKKERFIDNKDNTITDTKTGLQWVKDHAILGEKFSSEMTYKEAIAECKKLKLAGKKDWRLPTREELLSIVDLTRYNSAINPKFTNSHSSWYWTSTACAWNSSHAWCVYFDSGSVSYCDKDGTYYVRPVRSSQ